MVNPVIHLPSAITQALRGASLFAVLPGLILLSGCLEKQPDTERIIDGSYGGVGGGTQEISAHRIGNVTGTDGQEGSKSHTEVAHTDKSPGFGQDNDVPPPPGDAPSEGSDAPAHEERAHVDRPPGFGADPGDAPPGAPGGAASNSLPNIPSPFEEAYKGEEMVVVSGVVSAPDGISGIGDMDCFVPAPESPARRTFVNKIKVRVPGTYTMNVPKDFGPLLISVFLDQDQDGPDPSDPQGSYEDTTLAIGGEDVSDIDITLAVNTQ